MNVAIRIKRYFNSAIHLCDTVVIKDTMLSVILFSILSYTSGGLSWEIQSQGHDGIKFDRLDCICKEEGDIKMPTRIYNWRIEKSIFYSSIQINVTEDIPENIVYNVQVKKCMSRENLDTCENFYNFRTHQYCKLMKGGWASVYGNMKPKYTCPIKKGIYESTNSTFDLKGFPLVPVNGLYWKVKATISNADTDETYQCCLVETYGKFKRRNEKRSKAQIQS